MAVDDHLRAPIIAISLSSTGFISVCGLQMGGLSLHCLGAANLSPHYRLPR